MVQVVSEVKRQLPDVRVEVTDRFNYEYAEVSVRLTGPSGAKLHAYVDYDSYTSALWPTYLEAVVNAWARELARIKEDPTCWSCHCHNPTLEGDDRWA